VAARRAPLFQNAPRQGRATPGAVTIRFQECFIIMSITFSRAAVLAALFAAVQLAACGGNDNSAAPTAAPVAAPSPSPAPAPVTTPPAAPLPPAAAVVTISPLKTLTYALTGPAAAGGDAGQVSAATASGATLSLGAAGQIVLAVDSSNSGFVVTTPDYLVVNRFAGSLLMLCDAAATPGTSAARYVAIATSVAAGGVAAEAVTRADALAGLRFFKLSDCAYQSGNGSQGQNTAADADSLVLEFDRSGNASSNASTTTYSAAEFSDLLANGTTTADGTHFAAYRFTIDGQPRTVIFERGRYDAGDAASGFVRLWLPQ
jgi:hypothetical protein